MIATSQGIVVSAFIYRPGEFLIAQRSANESFLPNHWELPGGHVDYGEPMEVALKREIREELQIDVTIQGIIGAFTYLSSNQRPTVEVDYFATLTEPSQTIKLNPDEHSDYKWIGAAEVDRYFEAGPVKEIIDTAIQRLTETKGKV